MGRRSGSGTTSADASREFEFSPIALPGELDQEFTEAPERLAHKLKIFCDRQEPATDHLQNVSGIVGGRRCLALERVALLMAIFVKRPNKVALFLADHVVVLLVVPEFVTAEEADLVMYTVQSFLFVLYGSPKEFPL